MCGPKPISKATKRRIYRDLCKLLDCDEVKFPPMMRITKVKMLRGRAKDDAKKKGFAPDELVIVDGSKVEKIEGDPVSFLLKRAKGD
jgi:hypothetical protein